MSPILQSRANASAIGYGAFSVAIAGDFQSIASQTVGSGGASSVSFTSIPNTYAHLQIRVLTRNTSSGNGNFNMVINNDTTTNYTFHSLEADGASAGAYGEGKVRTEAIQVGVQATASNSSSIYGVTIIDILDYANTNKYKSTRCLSGFDANGSGLLRFNSHLWNSTSAIDRLDFSNTTGNFVQYTNIAIYGIKGA